MMKRDQAVYMQLQLYSQLTIYNNNYVGYASLSYRLDSFSARVRLKSFVLTQMMTSVKFLNHSRKRKTSHGTLIFLVYGIKSPGQLESLRIYDCIPCGLVRILYVGLFSELPDTYSDIINLSVKSNIGVRVGEAQSRVAHPQPDPN